MMKMRPVSGTPPSARQIWQADARTHYFGRPFWLDKEWRRLARPKTMMTQHPDV